MEKYKILVVDDEEHLTDVLESLLSEEYDGFSATNAKDALAIMEENDIALVISDHRMPGMSGSEFLAEVKRRHPNTVRIILSAHIDQALLWSAVNEMDAHCVLAKPWPPGRIEAAVKTWIGHYAKARAGKMEPQMEDKLQKQIARADELALKLSELGDRLEGLLERSLEFVTGVKV